MNKFGISKTTIVPLKRVPLFEVSSKRWIYRWRNPRTEAAKVAGSKGLKITPAAPRDR
jgi:hypothetical protein